MLDKREERERERREKKRREGEEQQQRLCVRGLAAKGGRTHNGKSARRVHRSTRFSPEVADQCCDGNQTNC